MTAARFVDTTRSVWAFIGDDIAVACPRCSSRAWVVPAVMDPDARILDDPRSPWSARRLSCVGCGHSAAHSGTRVCTGGGVDPYFALPLWLRTTVRGNLLWAYSGEHLGTLEAFVSARVREKPLDTGIRMTMIAKLPKWIKAAENRGAVLKGIARLRARLS